MTEGLVSHGKAESRIAARRRTRLRPVKIAGPSRRFLDEGTLVDRSAGGARIRRFSDCRLPTRILVLDEVERKFLQAAIIWSEGREIGVRFVGQELAPTHADMLRLTGRYYAVSG
ncbi:hypothetical protein [Jiella marina]|uniref:hypothetical protein n=1 Tax=Jiella sp. LLJ827 TaxID=2917712 RepID=UPI002100D949|nr:hypothetical protein [Jiella sp. LLJ827]MCQ0988173.1 hypothetical protein [Jiella sp. LLJ827]